MGVRGWDGGWGRGGGVEAQLAECLEEPRKAWVLSPALLAAELRMWGGRVSNSRPTSAAASSRPA